MQIKNVAVAGPNGILGPDVIRHLLKAGFNVTALTREPEKTSKAYPEEVKVVKANYDSVDDLVPALRNDGASFDAVVCLINRGILQSQTNLIDAAIAAGIPHFIPSSFGMDMRIPEHRELPQLSQKREMEDYLIKKASFGLITYTIIQSGIFLDFMLEKNLVFNFTDGQAVSIFDGGNIKMSASVLDTISEAVASALLRRDEVTNRYCLIQSAVVTQNQLLRYAREIVPDRKFETVDIDTALEEKEALERLRNGDNSVPAPRTFILRNSFRRGNGLFKETDNDLLGLKTWDEGQLKALVKRVILG